MAAAIASLMSLWLPLFMLLLGVCRYIHYVYMPALIHTQCNFVDGYNSLYTIQRRVYNIIYSRWVVVLWQRRRVRSWVKSWPTSTSWRGNRRTLETCWRPWNSEFPQHEQQGTCCLHLRSDTPRGCLLQGQCSLEEGAGIAETEAHQTTEGSEQGTYMYLDSLPPSLLPLFPTPLLFFVVVLIRMYAWLTDCIIYRLFSSWFTWCTREDYQPVAGEEDSE